MSVMLEKYWHILLVAGALSVILILTTYPYGGNVTSLFHIDNSIAGSYTQPTGTVVLSMPGYDGQEYWQLARNMPKIFSPAEWSDINTLPPGPYAHQRFLLPFLAFGLSLGSDAFLPYAFLLINILALLGTAVVMTKGTSGKKIYAVAIALCPAAMVGLHFMLAEPLTLFLITLFLYRYLKEEKLDAINSLLLMLAVLTREINLVFVLGTLLYTLLKGRWNDLKAFMLPIGAFIALHALIYSLFGQIPFLLSADKKSLPFVAVWELLSGQKNYGAYTLSSIALFLGFVLPAFIASGYSMLQSWRLDYVTIGLWSFLVIMLVMPDHIWGSITSIGRVITPVYPLFFVWAARRDGTVERILAFSVGTIGVIAAIGLALSIHPYSLV